MTLPTSGPISTDMILAELQLAYPDRTYPLSFSDPDVLALVQKESEPVVMPFDFYGKSVFESVPPPVLPPLDDDSDQDNSEVES